MDNRDKGKHGVQSLEIGMQILRVIVNGHRGMMLKEIAEAAGMPASKVHRYMVSMVRCGVVEQNKDSARYDLGPFAMNIGLASMGRLDRIQEGLNAISELCIAIEETTALSTWSPNGPIVVRYEKPRRAVTVSVTTGSRLNMMTTVSGRIFGAYLASEAYAHLIEKEIDSSDTPLDLRSRNAVEKLFAETRRTGLAIIEKDHMTPGVVSVGAPVFNSAGAVTLVIAAVGFQGLLDTTLAGPVVSALKAAARKLSKRLGYPGKG